MRGEFLNVYLISPISGHYYNVIHYTRAKDTRAKDTRAKDTRAGVFQKVDTRAAGSNHICWGSVDPILVIVVMYVPELLVRELLTKS